MILPFALDALAKDKTEALAAQHGLELTHSQQWDFLQSTESLDLQAAPGSGKTSLIGLKLTLLAQGWTSTTRGICVLSHTNTAKDEITRRLAATPAGRRLLEFPHFIGTIQSFTNTFLALPNLRSRGIDIQTVDDTAYEEAALRLLDNHPAYLRLKAYTDRRHDGRDLVARAHYVCDAGELTVAGPAGTLPFKSTSPSGQQLIRLKNHLVGEGLFRYSDMFAIAEHHLLHHPDIAQAAAHRFPFVLLDEMQDTSDLQQRLLDQVFGGANTVVQRVGDVNQGIFTDRAPAPPRPSVFPLPSAAQLPVSRRFGTQIADLASLLTVQRHQTIDGAGPQGTVALLLFDDDCVPGVVPAFERLARETVPDHLLATTPPRVLASRLIPGTAKAFPQSLTCYLPTFTSPSAAQATPELITAVRAARTHLAAGDRRTATAQTWDAVRRAFRQSAGTALPAIQRIERGATSTGLRIRIVLHDLLRADIDDPAEWNALTERLREVVPQLAEVPPASSRRLDDLLRHIPRPAPPAEPAVDGAAPMISVATSIQRAKGETHAATLILECLDSRGRKYDVYETLALVAQSKDVADASPTLRKAAQLLFVGITRPTHLLALAVHRARVEPHLDALEARGWLVRSASPRW
ncbi:UvrD-helicase domain-containing protein [Streptomyces sp. NPDC058232]|uniref:UvrD-helicase domain-containing protein n=1 Tax=Streptomyces sp. NPDC058232 TaxID=3346393 RepID=UPI0036E9B134